MIGTVSLSLDKDILCLKFLIKNSSLLMDRIEPLRSKLHRFSFFCGIREAKKEDCESCVWIYGSKEKATNDACD
jgi:hypothetical protein